MKTIHAWGVVLKIDKYLVKEESLMLIEHDQEYPEERYKHGGDLDFPREYKIYKTRTQARNACCPVEKVVRLKITEVKKCNTKESQRSSRRLNSIQNKKNGRQ